MAVMSVGERVEFSYGFPLGLQSLHRLLAFLSYTLFNSACTAPEPMNYEKDPFVLSNTSSGGSASDVKGKQEDTYSLNSSGYEERPHPCAGEVWYREAAQGSSADMEEARLTLDDGWQWIDIKTINPGQIVALAKKSASYRAFQLSDCDVIELDLRQISADYELRLSGSTLLSCDDAGCFVVEWATPLSDEAVCTQSTVREAEFISVSGEMQNGSAGASGTAEPQCGDNRLVVPYRLSPSGKDYSLEVSDDGVVMWSSDCKADTAPLGIPVAVDLSGCYDSINPALVTKKQLFTTCECIIF